MLFIMFIWDENPKFTGTINIEYIHNKLLTHHLPTVIQPYIKPYYNITMKDMEQQD